MFGKQTVPMTEVQLAKEKTQAKKEMVGVLLTAPIGVAAMLYDFIWGLESHDPHKIPPYPWMRNRHPSSNDMPWGENALFEYHPMVATTWPLEEGEEDAHH
jgi:hypothetical protein